MLCYSCSRSLCRQQVENGHPLLFTHLTYVQLPWYSIFDGKQKQEETVVTQCGIIIAEL